MSESSRKSELWLPPFHSKQELFYNSEATEILWAGDTRGGKALSLDTLIPLYDGGYKTIGEIREGDKLITELGLPTTVEIAHPIIQEPESYELTFDNGTKIKACKDHQWLTFSHRERVALTRRSIAWRAKRRALRNPSSKTEISQLQKVNGTVRNTEEVYKTLKASGRNNHAIPVSQAISDRPDVDLPIHPYVLGAWLGDGDTNTGRISKPYPEMYDLIRSLGYEVRRASDNITHRIVGLTAQLRQLQLIGDKRVPQLYLNGSYEQRLWLLKGLMDTDGGIDTRGKVEFYNTNESIADAVRELCASLGWKSFKRSRIGRLYGVEHKRAYTITFSPDVPVFTLAHKLARHKISFARKSATNWHYIVDCKPIPSEPMRCLTVSNPTGLFLCTKNHIPTHNTAGIKLALIYWCSLIPGLQCDIFRLREDDVIAGYMQGDFGFPVLLNQWSRDKLVTINQTEIKFWNGSLIQLNHCFTDAALTKHQGVPKHVRVIDEAGQIPERRLKWLKLWMTMSNEAKEKIPLEWRERFPKIIYLMNRLGVSRNYFRKTFVMSRPKYAIEKVGAFTQQYIPAAVRDNPSEDADTTIERVNEAADSATAKALLSEDGWFAQTGSYFDMWDIDRHTVKDFIIPDFWLRYRTFDYGSYEPWACIWVAVSPGVSVHEGTQYERYLPRGCLVVYREWYGCKAEHPVSERDHMITNLAPKGWSNADIANGIIDRTEERFDGQPTFTDGFPFNNLGGHTIADDFKKHGLELTKGDTDRKQRGAQTASRLSGKKLIAGSDEKWPMLVFFESCKYCQDYMAAIERHENEGRLWDYKEDGEPTHIVDCITLSCMVHPIVKDAELSSADLLDKSMKSDKNRRKTVRDLLPDITL